MSSKTLGSFSSKIMGEEGSHIADIEDLLITLTEMTGAEGPFLRMWLEYNVISHSYCEYPGGSQMSEQVAFLNGAGGTMYLWDIDKDVARLGAEPFHLSCEDSEDKKRHRTVTKDEYLAQGWLNVWEGHAHSLSGLFRFCNFSEHYVETHIGRLAIRGSIH